MKSRQTVVYNDIRVIDGDTIELNTTRFGIIKCRIAGLDCDERGTKRGKEQAAFLIKYTSWIFFKPIIFLRVDDRGYFEKCSFERFMIDIYVFRHFWYRDYSKMMKKLGMVKSGSKWNR